MKIDIDVLKELASGTRKITRSKLAKSLGVSVSTIKLRQKEHGLHRNFSDISDDRLDDMIRSYKKERPDSGYQYVQGHLTSLGYNVQRQRVRQAIRRTDRLGSAIRTRQPVRRRKYKVKRPNAVWHLDGHHKLITWGIVIHGIVDGFSRKVSNILNKLRPLC
jgi:hypothetical protein